VPTEGGFTVDIAEVVLIDVDGGLVIWCCHPERGRERHVGD
jgi:hypothetical protein